MAELPSHEDFEKEHLARHPSLDEPDCYACRLSTVSLQFTYGKADFHGPTLGERVTQQHKDQAEQGKVLGRDYDTAWRR